MTKMKMLDQRIFHAEEKAAKAKAKLEQLAAMGQFTAGLPAQNYLGTKKTLEQRILHAENKVAETTAKLTQLAAYAPAHASAYTPASAQHYMGMGTKTVDQRILHTEHKIAEEQAKLEHLIALEQLITARAATQNDKSDAK